MVACSLVARLSLSIAMFASSSMAFMGHQPVIGGSFTRQYSRGLSYQYGHQSRAGSHCTKIRMGLKDESNPPAAVYVRSVQMEATVNDEIEETLNQIVETFDLSGMAKHLELSLQKDIPEPPRANLHPRVAKPSQNMSMSTDVAPTRLRLGPIMLSAPSTAPSTKPSTKTSPPASLSTPKPSAPPSARTWRVGAALLSTGNSAAKRDSAPQAYPAHWTPPSQAQAPTPSVPRSAEDKPVARTWRVGAALLSIREPAPSTGPAALASPSVPRSGSDRPSVKTWRVGAALLSVSDSGRRPTPTGQAAVGAAAVSTAAAVAPLFSWSGPASPPPALATSASAPAWHAAAARCEALGLHGLAADCLRRGGASPGSVEDAVVSPTGGGALMQRSGERTRAWRVGAAMVSIREAAAASRSAGPVPTAAAAAATAPLFAAAAAGPWASSSPAAASTSPAAQAQGGCSEERVAAGTAPRAWRVGAALVSIREPASSPETRVAATSAAAITSQSSAWRLGSAAMVSLPPTGALSAPIPAAATEAAAGDSWSASAAAAAQEQFTVRTWRVGAAMVSGREAAPARRDLALVSASGSRGLSA